MHTARASQQAFLGVSTLLFATCAVVTIAWCASMSGMGGMSMPGGWTMSMTWMRMPGQSWPGIATGFLGMWIVMMVAMMLPSLIPMLWRYRQLADPSRLGRLTLLVAVGYFLIWTLFGMIAFPIGVALTSIEMRQPALARAVPMAIALIVSIAGAIQLSAWKTHQLMCCRSTHAVDAMNALGALRHGVRLGLDCSRCCSNLMVIPLILGIMDVRVMAVVTAAITCERLAPAGERVARIIGIVMIASGLLLLTRAL